MEARVRQVYDTYDTQRRQLDVLQADAEDIKMLEDLEKSLKGNNG